MKEFETQEQSHKNVALRHIGSDGANHFERTLPFATPLLNSTFRPLPNRNRR
jgi:hypothetical protein